MAASRQIVKPLPIWIYARVMDFRLFASKIVHAELTRAGYQPPSLRTVARWTSSGKAPAWVEQAMRELLGTQKEAAPDWGRLVRTLDAIAERVGASDLSEQPPPLKERPAGG